MGDEQIGDGSANDAADKILIVSPLLKDVPSNNFFILANGRTIRNLQQLYDAMTESGDEEFYHHVTPERNDFVNWIRACVKDSALADRLGDVTQKEEFLGLVAEEIATLKNPKIAETLKYFSAELPSEKEAEKAGVPDPNQEKPATVTDTNPVPDASIQTPQTAAAPADDSQKFEFEDILKAIIDEVDQEILAWDA